MCAEGGVCSMQSRRMVMEGRRSWNYFISVFILVTLPNPKSQIGKVKEGE